MVLDPTIFNTVQALIVGLDPDGTIRFFNAYCEQITGWPRHEALGKNWFEHFIPARLRLSMQSILAELLESTHTGPVESILLTRTGQERVVAWHNTVLRTESGRVTLVVGAGIDVTEQREAENMLHSLNAAAMAVQQARSEQEIFAVTAQELTRLGFECTVLLTDAGESDLEIVFTTFPDADLDRAERLLGAAILGYHIPVASVREWDIIRRERRALLITQPAALVREIFSTAGTTLAEQASRLPKLSRLIVAPMTIGATILGVLTAHSDHVTEVYLPGMTAFANQVAVALRNARLHAETQRRVIEQSTLLAASRIASSSLDLPQVLTCLAEHLCKAIDATSSYICDWDPETDTATVLAEYVAPDVAEQDSDLGVTYNLGRDFPGASEMLRQALPQITHRDDPTISAIERAHMELYGAHTTLLIPLVVKEAVIGFAELWESRRRREFTPREIALCQGIAQHVAIAIANTRLFEAEAQRRREAETLRQITSVLASTLDLDQVLDLILEQLAQVIRYDSAAVFLLQNDRLVVTAGRGFPEPERVMGMSFTTQENTLFQHIQTTRAPLVLPDARADPRFFGRGGTHYVRGWMGIPLMVKDRIIGHVTVDSRQPNAFDNTDATLVQAFANQAAIAIENARLFEANERRWREAETLRAATQALSATLDLQQIFDLILSELQQVVPYDSASVQELKGERLEIIGGRGFPNLEELLGLSFDLSAADHPNGQVIRTRAPLILGDAPTHYDEFHREPHAQAAIRSWLGVPLLFGDQVIGMITLDKRESGFYNEEHVRLALAYAAQAAIAVENARLFQTERAQAQRQAALSRLSADLAATLEVDQVCWRVVNGLHATLGYRFIGLFLLDQATGERVLAATVGWPTAPPVNWRLPPGHGLSERPLWDGQLHYSPDVSQEPSYVPGLGGSEVDVPLKLGEQILGVLAVESAKTHDFDQHDFEVLTAAANQSAVAIQNARLYETQRQQADELARLHRASAPLLFAAPTDLPSLAQNIVEAVLSEFGQANCSLLLLDRPSGEIKRIAAVGPYVPEVQSACLRLDGRGLVPRAIRMGQIVNAPDVLTDPDYVPSWKGARSEMVVPLRAGDQIIGALDMQSTQPYAFGPADERLLTAYAERAALALENTRLYQETARRADEMASLYYIGLATSSSLSLDQVLTSIYEQCKIALPCEHFYVALHRADEPTITFPIFIGQGKRLQVPPVEFAANEGFTAYIIRQRCPLMVQDVSNVHKTLPIRPMTVTDTPPDNYLGVPLILRDQVIGVLSVQSSDPAAYSKDHMRLLSTIAAQAAIAIENARLYTTVQEYANSLQEVAAERQYLFEQLQKYTETLEEQVTARTAEIFAEKEKIEAVLKSTADPIIITDHAGRVTYVNDAFTTLSGYTVSEVLDQCVADVIVAHETPAATVSHFHQAITQGILWRGDLFFVHKDGRPLEVEATLAPVCDHAGDIINFAIGLRDVSQARALERAKSEFLTNVSHQLRTPVTNLKTYTYLLNKGTPEKHTQYVQVVQNEVEKLLHLVEGLIEIVELDAEPIVTEWQSVPLLELVHATVLRYHSQAQAAGLTLRADLPDPPPPAAMGSKFRLSQALNQIVENALSFTEQGEIVVGAYLDAAANTPELVLWVSDTGPGIPRADQEKLFERFYRGEIAKPGHIIGTGLGLAIANTIVQAHRGHITLRSAVGQGSTFEIRLPVIQ